MHFPTRPAAFLFVVFVLAASLIEPSARLRLERSPAAPRPAHAEGTTPTADALTYLPVLISHPLPTATRTPTPTATPTPTPTPTAAPTDQSPQEQAIVTRINQERAARGLAPLAVAPQLIQAARRHSRDMAEHHFTGHTGSDGSTSGRRMREAGYDWIAHNEIIGWGFSDPDAMMAWWMNDKPHRDIILSSAYEDLGVGYVMDPASDWTHYWTVDFGTRASGEMDLLGDLPSASHSSDLATIR